MRDISAQPLSGWRTTKQIQILFQDYLYKVETSDLLKTKINQCIVDGPRFLLVYQDDYIINNQRKVFGNHLAFMMNIPIRPTSQI